MKMGRLRRPFATRRDRTDRRFCGCVIPSQGNCHVIRRDWTAPDGTRCWLLISQIEHAHLAGQLASQWAVDPFAAVAERPEVVAAIVHHDDGWAEWERLPDVDPESGRPLSFMEMPLTESLAIWRDSIDRAADLGNLASWMVASHFTSRLLQSSMAETDPARTWVADMRHRQADWLAAWQAEAPADNRPEIASLAVAYMRMFDTLSLWFCTAEQTRPHDLATPEGLAIRFTPQPSGNVIVAPWPLRSDRLDLTARGEAVPIAGYGSPADLAAAVPRTPIRLQWRVTPLPGATPINDPP